MFTKVVSFTDLQKNNEKNEFELVGLEIEMLCPDVEQDFITNNYVTDVLCSDEEKEQELISLEID